MIFYLLSNLFILINTIIRTLFPKIKLSNNMNIYYYNYNEVKILDDEIIKQNVYNEDKLITRDNPIIIDIGSNIGLFSAKILNKYPKAIVHAIEPIEELQKITENNLQLYNNESKSYQYAIGSINEFIDINFIRLVSFGSEKKNIHRPLIKNIMDACYNKYSKNYLYKFVYYLYCIYYKIINKSIINQRVVCIKLKDFINNILNNDIIDLIKIDVEGMEYDVISSLTENELKKIKNIVIEIEDNDTSDKIEQFFINKDFESSISYNKIFNDIDVRIKILTLTNKKYLKL